MNEASTVQSPNPALSYDMEQPPIKPTQLSSAAMPEPTLSSSSPSQCKRLSSNTTAEMPPQSQLQDQLSGQRIVIEQPDGESSMQNQSNSALVSAVIRTSSAHTGNQSGHTVAASIQANIQHESALTSNANLAVMSSSEHLAPLLCASYDNRHQNHKGSKATNLLEDEQDRKLVVSDRDDNNDADAIINYDDIRGNDFDDENDQDDA